MRTRAARALSRGARVTASAHGTVTACELPGDALLRAYADAGYTDCFAARLPGACALSEYVERFLTTGLFRLERRLLAWFAGAPSQDGDARALASGECDRFAVWEVEARTGEQLLLADRWRMTRSWWMVRAVATAPGRAAHACLYFGSAVPRAAGTAAVPASAMASRAGAFALAPHRFYSRRLLGAARRALVSPPSGGAA